MKERKKLSDIISADSAGTFRDAWNTTKAAADSTPIPRGEYICRVISGELDTSKQKSTPSYKLKFEVIEGPHLGRQVWHDCWLTAAALPMTKRDLTKIGITTTEQMEQPVPPGIVCKLIVVLHNDDDGVPHNKVKNFEFLRIDKPTPNPFPAEAPPEAAIPPEAADTSASSSDGETPAAGSEIPI